MKKNTKFANELYYKSACKLKINCIIKTMTEYVFLKISDFFPSVDYDLNSEAIIALNDLSKNGFWGWIVPWNTGT